jgi:hypothetical protein
MEGVKLAKISTDIIDSREAFLNKTLTFYAVG